MAAMEKEASHLNILSEDGRVGVRWGRSGMRCEAPGILLVRLLLVTCVFPVTSAQDSYIYKNLETQITL